MTLKIPLPATLVLGAGLAMAGAALAQTPDAGAPSSPALAQTAPPVAPPNLSLPKPADPNASYPTYSVPPPHESSSGLYLPAVVGGYVKSTAGCVVVGCADGPSVGGAPSSSGAEEPPPPPPTPPASPGSPAPQ